MKKKRIVQRFHLLIREVIDAEAAWQGIKSGTLINHLLQEELAKIDQVGVDHCLIDGSAAWRACAEELQRRPQAYYLLPSGKLVERYIPQRDRGQDAGEQVSLFFTEEQIETLKILVVRQGAKNTYAIDGRGEPQLDADGQPVILSYRWVLAALLRNNPVCRELYSPV